MFNAISRTRVNGQTISVQKQSEIVETVRSARSHLKEKKMETLTASVQKIPVVYRRYTGELRLVSTAPKRWFFGLLSIPQTVLQCKVEINTNGFITCEWEDVPVDPSSSREGFK